MMFKMKNTSFVIVDEWILCGSSAQRLFNSVLSFWTKLKVYRFD